ncbi:cell division topological specificity factor MinE [Anaerotalea alkaliphila]|uniref:Cell division topological specificity factor n=1 Tax=Anaerotalea alkaliphila TaxID=2662126 RepID=A0A7X5HWI6_9FIRM|nr:cell division topological specificity factor MinE [Anaerotalea alkaliphila]NDL67945.1 cell division topological specificity factor MinE [Anaerotalea alkaliphila]
MFDFFTRKGKSKSVAKDRLKLVLIHDRANCSTEVLELMRADIIRTISKYMEIDEEALEFKVGTTKSDTSENLVPALFANIPIKSVKRQEVL